MTVDTLVIGIVTLAGAGLTAGVMIWLGLRGDRHDNKSENTGEPAISESPVEPRLDRVLRTRVLRCGVVNHPPLATWSSSDTPVFGGLYVEIAREVRAQQDLSLEFVALDWGMLERSFDDHNLDLVLSIFETKARLEYADFVAAFHKVGVSGVVRTEESRVKELRDLYDPSVRVSVVLGEVGWEFVTIDLQLPKRRTVLIDSSSLRTVFSPLVSGESDVAICDDLTCHRFVTDNPGYEHIFAYDSLYLCKNGIMVPKGDPAFARWVDRVFTEARSVPEILELETKALAETDGWVRRFR